jgi:hypothetical protein
MEAGQVPDCYLGLLLDPADDAEVAAVLVVNPAALLHPSVPHPDGTMLYAPLTGHADRLPHDLVFLAARHLEQPWRRPAGRRRHGPRRLAPWPAQGGAAWRADHRGSPGATPAGHDVCA